MKTSDEAKALLVKLRAPPRLLTHAALVGEAADALLETLAAVDLPVDHAFVRIGAALHDAGKIVHPEELFQGGNRHEAEGGEPFAGT